MQIELESWEDGRLESLVISELDRWAVQSAHKLTARLGSTAVTLQQQPQALSSRKLGVAAVSWDGAFVLAAYLRAAYPLEFWLQKRAVELGAGPGLVGLFLAVWGAKVVLTDRLAVLPFLQQNVDINDTDGTLRTSVAELQWGSEGYLERAERLAKPGCDIIVAADCLYLDQVGETPSVLHFIKACWALSRPCTTCFVAFECRSATLRSAFLTHGKLAFRQVQLLSQGSIPKGFRATHVELFSMTGKKDGI